MSHHIECDISRGGNYCNCLWDEKWEWIRGGGIRTANSKIILIQGLPHEFLRIISYVVTLHNMFLENKWKENPHQSLRQLFGTNFAEDFDRNPQSVPTGNQIAASLQVLLDGLISPAEQTSTSLPSPAPAPRVEEHLITWEKVGLWENGTCSCGEAVGRTGHDLAKPLLAQEHWCQLVAARLGIKVRNEY